MALVVVVIPCYRVKSTILSVIRAIGGEAGHIICVDDACPDGSGKFIEAHVNDGRVEVVFHKQNAGVGGAMVSGYRRALELKADVVVKIDGDGQMDPTKISDLVRPILAGKADYSKGNRFYSIYSLNKMPPLRRLGNSVLSLVTKASSGYWHIYDPTNGYTAIHTSALKNISLGRIHSRFFFESDMLFQLNLIRAVVIDIPMTAVYGDESSNLSVAKQLLPFAIGNCKNLAKRLFYNYILLDFNIATVLLLIGCPLLAFGFIFGSYHWIISIQSNLPATAGTVMASALPVIVGLQMVLSALNFDITNVPTIPISELTAGRHHTPNSNSKSDN